jgi:dTDP-4-amino-4,6-dideoxygalactose transaminase
VADFERALAGYTGALDVVTVDSCTNALGLCLEWRRGGTVSLPRRTYVGVGLQARRAGYQITWRDEDWAGRYELQPWGIWDSAKRFTAGMYQGGLECVSFHVGKILGLGRGGAILTDDPYAAAWFRRMRHDGRTPGRSTEEDRITALGWHCALTPPEAALGLWRLEWLPRDNADLPNEHTDISQHPVFRP